MATISISDTSPRVQYTVGGTPTTVPWTITFPFFDLDDLLVYEDDTLKTRDVDYSVSGTAVDDGYSGGTITWLSSISSVTLTIVRDIPVERTTDFPTSGYFDIAALNTALDKIIAIQQELETKLLRAVKLADTDSNTTPGDLPTASDGKALYWNGTTLDNSTVNIEDLATAVTDAQAAETAAQAAQAAAEAALDEFDDVYLGSKASAPTLDNDGDPLAEGTLYWNSTTNELNVYNGSAWEAAAPGVSGYLALSGGTMTGKITLDGNPSSGNHAANKTYVDTMLPLAGGTLSGNVNFADNEAQRPKLKDYSESVNIIGSIGGGTQNIDLELGNVVTGTVDTSTTTFTISNPPASGSAGSFTLILTNGGSQTVNWPASVDWPGGTAPTLTAAGVDILSFITTDGGTTWLGLPAGMDMQ